MALVDDCRTNKVPAWRRAAGIEAYRAHPEGAERELRVRDAAARPNTRQGGAKKLPTPPPTSSTSPRSGEPDEVCRRPRGVSFTYSSRSCRPDRLHEKRLSYA